MTRCCTVILNYRTGELALQALESLAEQIDPARDVAVVVDNASGDASPRQIAEGIERRGWQAWARLVESGRNGGFSAGNNLGIGSVDARYYLLLNSDAYLRPGAFEALLAAAEAEPAAGVLSPRLEWPDGQPQTSCFRVRTPVGELIEAAASGPVTGLLGRWNVPIPPSDSVIHPEWTSFACVLLRRELVQAIGPMDEGYFMYFDDIDYCRRARSAGFQVAHRPEARVVHLRGGSGPVKAAASARRRLPGYYYASRARYFAKFHGLPGLWAANLLWLVGRGISLFRERVGGRPTHVSRDAWRDIWTHSLRPLVSPGRPIRRMRPSASEGV